MNATRCARACGFALCCGMLLSAVPARAQISCEDGNGPLKSDSPEGFSTDEVIRKFASREAQFKAAFASYSYSVDMTVQSLNGNGSGGEMRRTTAVTVDERGKRHETVTFASVSTLRIGVTQEDYDDADSGALGMVTPENLQAYFVKFLGRQKVDELSTYVFDIAPKKIEKGKGFFQGTIWVDDHDLVIVKTCGRSMRTDELPEKNGRLPRNVAPVFVTYREQVDAVNWFPTYSKADEVAEFPRGAVRVKEIVKHTQYKKSDVTAAAK